MQDTSSAAMTLAIVSMFVTAFTTLCAALFPFFTELMRLKAARRSKQQEFLETTLLSCFSEFTESFARLRAHAGGDAIYHFTSSCYRLYGLLPDEESRKHLFLLSDSLHRGNFSFDATSLSVMQISCSVAELITLQRKTRRHKSD